MGNHRQQSEVFEWLPGGLSLLDTINEIIEDNGGIEAMYELVDEEVNVDKFKTNRRKMEEGFRHVIKYKISRNDASELMGMNFHDYDRQFKDYKIKHHIHE